MKQNKKTTKERIAKHHLKHVEMLHKALYTLGVFDCMSQDDEIRISNMISDYPTSTSYADVFKMIEKCEDMMYKAVHKKT